MKAAFYSLALGAALLVTASTASVRAEDRDCTVDLKALCAGVAPGEGRIQACIQAHISELSVGCSSRLSKAAWVFMDVPSHPDPLIVTDAAINIAPDLDAKVDIIQNAIDLAHAMGVTEVRVAILSAMETVTAKVPSTIEAAALCKMAERGQITGAVLDGPLALDNAISPEAAAIKKIASPVAGRANILVVPDLEAGNMLAKSLTFLAGADAAGIVLGARVPVILTSRADTLLSRLASCAVAVMVAAARRKSAVASVAQGDRP